MLIGANTDVALPIAVILAVALGLLSFHTGVVLAVATVVLGIIRVVFVIGMIVPLILYMMPGSATGENVQLVAGVVFVSAVGLFQTALLAALVKRSRLVPTERPRRRRRS